MLKIGRNDPCPCKSGLKAKHCCLISTSTLVKQPADIKAKATSRAEHAKCYARHTRNCGVQISDEHPISDGLLKQIGLNRTTKVAGFKWQQPRTFKIIPDRSMGSAVLCKEHNEALSPLDSQMIRFSSTLQSIDDDLRDSNGSKHDHFLFAGEDLERWMLKAVIGLTEANMIHGHVPAGSVELLFGSLSWPKGLGLYLDTFKGRETYHQDAFSIETRIIKGTDEIGLFRCKIRGLPLTLAFNSKVVRHVGFFRPSRIVFKGSGITRTIHLSWSHYKADGEIVLERKESYDGSAPDWPDWARKG